MQADSIKIECEDDGFHLVIDGYDPSGKYRVAEFNFNIHSCAEALHEQVNLIIGGWLAEGQAVHAEVLQYTARDVCCAPEDIDESGDLRGEGAYPLDDPKHPAFHSVHADLWDAREGK